MEIIHPFGGKTQVFETEFAGKKLTIETGRMAFLADGAALVTYGDTVVLGTATIANQPREGIDFFPLMVDYEERMYASGKISGSRFVKREGRPSEHAILTSRLIDRPIRPLFPKGYRNDVQVVATTLSYDFEHEPDIVAMIAASSALMLAGAPFSGPIAGVRIGKIGGELMAMPTVTQLVGSELDLTVAGTEDAIMMVEAGAKEVSEEEMVRALEMAHKVFQPVIKLQQEMVKAVPPKEKPYELFKANEELRAKIDKFLAGRLGKAIRHQDHYLRHDALRNLELETLAEFEADHERAEVLNAFNKVIDDDIRRGITEDGTRPDNRQPTEIRPLSMQVGVLPRTHGSALFTRGTTQALTITTLASASAGQLIDTMEEDTTKHYIHHYNFPPYATGEAKPLRSTGRREIGHGALAERALEPVIPSVEEFPYTIRVVSEIVTSNGSTSMASVCGSTLSLMDAGVPIAKPIAGIAMGLVMDKGGQPTILSDIAGVEDFAGDMDFKVAGSKDGITALQMDIKIKGITVEIMARALEQALEGRMHIMNEMAKCMDKPRTEISRFAPRITKLQIRPDKIREVIGKGGETINKIIAATGVEIDIDDDGMVVIASNDETKAREAMDWIKSITQDPEVGKVYQGKVIKLMDFGAFVEILPGKEGLVHISQLAEHRVEKVEDEVAVGDIIPVKLMEIDNLGRLNLSKKAAE